MPLDFEFARNQIVFHCPKTFSAGRTPAWSRFRIGIKAHQRGSPQAPEAEANRGSEARGATGGGQEAAEQAGQLGQLHTESADFLNPDDLHTFHTLSSCFTITLFFYLKIHR